MRSQPYGLALFPTLPGQLPVKAIGSIIGLPYKVVARFAGQLLQSGRACSYKVVVDKLLYDQTFPRKAGPQALEIRAIRPLTGGGLLRSAMPRSSSSRSAPWYWLSTISRVWRNTRLKLSIRP
jgi:hypothetical protein